LAIGKATLAIGVLSLLAKVVALGKEMAVAARFGVGPEMDSFALGFAATTFISGLVINALPAAFIPAYHAVRAKVGQGEAGRLPAEILTLALVGNTLLMLLFAAVHRPLLQFLAPGASPATARLIRIAFLGTLPMIVFQGCSSVWGAALNAEGRFRTTSLVPAVTSLTILAFLAAAGSAFKVPWLVAALATGACLEALILGWVLRKSIPWARFRLVFPERPVLRSFLSQFFPVSIGSVFIGSTLVIDMGFASRLGKGEASALAYGARVPSLILSLSSVALATATLPYLSRLAASEDFAEIRRTLRHLVLAAGLAGAFIALVCIALSEPITTLIFRRGAFTAAHVKEVAHIQSMYCIQLPFFLAGTPLVRFILAMKRSHLLFYGTILSAVLNFSLDYLLAPRMGSAGIALSTSLVYVASCVFLGWGSLRILAQDASTKGSL
jgi:putative peptidoglycan lipid II flippase